MTSTVNICIVCLKNVFWNRRKEISDTNTRNRLVYISLLLGESSVECKQILRQWQICSCLMMKISTDHNNAVALQLV